MAGLVVLGVFFLGAGFLAGSVSSTITFFDGAGGFADIFTITNTGGAVTDYVDVDGATNVPARYYRVRLVP